MTNKILTDLSGAKLAYACEANMREWYIRKLTASGGKIFQENGLIFGYSKIPSLLYGANKIIPFPHFKRKDADIIISKMLKYYRKINAGPWCTCGQHITPRFNREILRSWGFVYEHPGTGMACRLNRLKEDFKKPKGLKIQINNTISFKRSEHPTYGLMNNESRQTALKGSRYLTDQKPQLVYTFLATINGHPVGYTMLNISDGVAGIYDVGTKPSYRRKNVGKSVVLAACRFAKDLGYKVAVLQTSSVLTPIFKKIGFRDVTIIDHWSYPAGSLRHALPTKSQRQKILSDSTSLMDKFKTTLLTGQQKESINMIKKYPKIVQTPFPGSRGVMPLHSAAWNGYSDVVRLLIKLNAPLEACDDPNGATPLLWAVHGYSREGPQIKRDQLSCAEMMIKAGADTAFISKWNHSALEIAKNSHDKKMFNLLKRYQVSHRDPLRLRG